MRALQFVLKTLKSNLTLGVKIYICITPNLHCGMISRVISQSKIYKNKT